MITVTAEGTLKFLLSPDYRRHATGSGTLTDAWTREGAIASSYGPSL